MTRAAPGSIMRQIESLFDGGSIAGLSDIELLERFNTHRDAAREAAFAALVARHGPMVLRVCLLVLGDRHHAEDAFQAVFLVLARKANSIRDPHLLGTWLYGVAIRTAQKARVRNAHVRRNEEGLCADEHSSGSSVLIESPARSAEDSAIAREQAEAVHDEIDRLPKSFRLPVVLCYFEGLSLDEAGRRLEWPAGTVRSRLARARDKLRRGLIRRGVVLPGAALAAALSPGSASASVSRSLCDATTRAAIRFAAGAAGTPVAAALAHEVLRSMLANKLKLTALSLLLLGAVAGGAGYWTHPPATPSKANHAQPGQHSGAIARPDDQRPAPGRMTVSGSVLDPTGKPMASVPVELIGRPRRPFVAGDEWRSPYASLGRGTTGADGRFRFDAERTSRVGFLQVQAVAAAPGFGLSWAAPNPDAEQPAGEIRLRPEQVIRGKLIDLNGKPIAGLEVFVKTLRRGNDDWIGGFPWHDILSWPPKFKTDGQGRFTLPGIGRDMTVHLGIDDPRFAKGTVIQVDTTDPESLKDLRYVLQPATIVEGRALAADTGRPIPHAIVSVGSSINEFWSGAGPHFPADDQGRFTANVALGQYYSVRAYPPEGQPYLIPEHRFEWNKGGVKRVMDVSLPRGVLIRGKVVEEGTNQTLAGATVQYFANPRNDEIISYWHAIVASKSDGSFQIAVQPGKGHLLVFGPTPDYILEEIGASELWYGRPGGWRTYAHDIIPYEVKLGDSPREIVATVRRGKTIRGRLVSPVELPVESAAMLTRLEAEDSHPQWGGAPRLYARDGRFELHGLDPERSVPVVFFDADHQWGAAVELSGKQSGDELTVRLQPNGRATARFVGPDGRPVAGFAPSRGFHLLVTPGPPNFTRSREHQGQRLADAGDMENIDPRHYLDFPRAEADGRVTLPNLVPGALYRICDRSTEDVPGKGVQVRKDFVVKTGEELDLGDILIEKPRG